MAKKKVAPEHRKEVPMVKNEKAKPQNGPNEGKGKKAKKEAVLTPIVTPKPKDSLKNVQNGGDMKPKEKKKKRMVKAESRPSLSLLAVPGARRKTLAKKPHPRLRIKKPKPEPEERSSIQYSLKSVESGRVESGGRSASMFGGSVSSYHYHKGWARGMAMTFSMKDVMQFLEVMKGYASKLDTFALAHALPKHRLCIYLTCAMIPLSVLISAWDLLAAEVFQIPDLSTINAPGFVLFINFIAMPLAMYGYMMEYLMHENSRETVIGMICVVTHPILFFIRAFMEYWYDGYRNQQKLFFERPQQGNPFVYPDSVMFGKDKIT